MVKVGVIGCGYWGPNVIRNFNKNERGKLVYCCDLNKNALQSVRRNYPAAEVTSDYHELIQSKNVDAVAIVTPLSTHYTIAREALLAGKHVFVEKPFTQTLKEAETLIELAQKKRRVILVGQTYLYSPPVKLIKQMIQKNELGQLHYINSTRVHFGHLRPNESVIWDLASHDLSILFYWIKDYKYNVFCSGRDCLHRGFLDTANITLEPQNGGPMAYIFVSWLAPIKMRNMVITGSKQMVFYNDNRTSEEIKIYNQCAIKKKPKFLGEHHQMVYHTGDVHSPRLETAEPLAEEIDDFLKSVQTGREPLSSASFNLNVIKALEAIDKSLVTGRKIVVKF